MNDIQDKIAELEKIKDNLINEKNGKSSALAARDNDVDGIALQLRSASGSKKVELENELKNAYKEMDELEEEIEEYNEKIDKCNKKIEELKKKQISKR